MTETSTRHTLLTKHKHFHDTTQTKLTSNSGRLIGETNEAPIDIDTTTELGPVIRREESDDEDVAVTLAAIPAADETAAGNDSSNGRRPKRARKNTETETAADPDQDVEIVSDSQEEDVDDPDNQDDQDDLFVHDDVSTRPPPSKRRKGSAKKVGESAEAEAEIDKDDKKKLAMDISYEGFSIYGRVLCLVVKRRDGNIGSGPQQQAGRGSKAATAAAGSHATKPGGGGQAMMENFIISTQIPAGEELS